MDYIINKNTNFILFDGNNTCIYEINNNLLFKGNVINDILNESCIYYGSTLKGRIVSCKKIINSYYKVPIIISEKNNLLFFYVNANNIIYWFNFLNIKEYYKYNNNLMVVFNNEFNLTLNISYSVFHNQILKCSRLLVIYNSR